MSLIVASRIAAELQQGQTWKQLLVLQSKTWQGLLPDSEAVVAVLIALEVAESIVRLLLPDLHFWAKVANSTWHSLLRCDSLVLLLQ